MDVAGALSITTTIIMVAVIVALVWTGVVRDDNNSTSETYKIAHKIQLAALGVGGVCLLMYIIAVWVGFAQAAAVA